jgi:hypothetical protein
MRTRSLAPQTRLALRAVPAAAIVVRENARLVCMIRLSVIRVFIR